jgi:hypothetical protein
MRRGDSFENAEAKTERTPATRALNRTLKLPDFFPRSPRRLATPAAERTSIGPCHTSYLSITVNLEATVNIVYGRDGERDHNTAYRAARTAQGGQRPSTFLSLLCPLPHIGITCVL